MGQCTFWIRLSNERWREGAPNHRWVAMPDSVKTSAAAEAFVRAACRRSRRSFDVRTNNPDGTYYVSTWLEDGSQV